MKTLVVIYCSSLISLTSFCQDTLNFVYEKSKLPNKEGNVFTREGGEIFVSKGERVAKVTIITIVVDTTHFEMRWGTKRELFRGQEHISNISRIFTPINPFFDFTIDGVSYKVKKVKQHWEGIANGEAVFTFDFYKKKKARMIRYVALKDNANEVNVVAAAFYCADDLIRNKETTFDKAIRYSVISGLVK